MKRWYSFVPIPLVFCAAFLIISMDRSHRANDDYREPGESRSGAMAALDFWSQSRAYPFNDIPSDRYNVAFRLNKRRFKSEPRGLTGGTAGWQSIGPENLTGRMISVALNPLNPSTIYAGSASGGVWRSYTGGVAGDWQRITTGFPVLGVGAIAISPTDSNTIYIGTGEVYRYQGSYGGIVVRTTRGSYGMGILRSTDGGTTWTKSLDWSYNEERGVQSIKINPLNPNTVWAATTDGVYRTQDAGESWTLVAPFYMCEDLVIHPVDTTRVLVSSGNITILSGIYLTSDNGANWTPVNPTGYTGKALLDSPPTSPDLVYASIADDTTGVGSLWKSTNFGLSWTTQSDNTTNNIFGVQGWYSHFVAVHPDSLNLVYHASVGIGRSTDGGVTFSHSIAGGYSDNHEFAYDPSNPNILYVVNDDGVYRSTNFGRVLMHVSSGLATGQLYNGFSNSSTDSLLALTQSQDHIPGYRYTGSPTWTGSASDESGWTAIDPTNDSIMYCLNRYGGTIFKSTDRGVSFSARSSFGTNGAWNSPVIVSPSVPATIYVAKTRVFKSTNGASSWTTTNGGADLDGDEAISVAISATSPDTVFVGTAPRLTSAHIFRTTNGGLTWTNVTGNLPDRYPLDIAVDPSDSRKVYVACGGFGTGHLFRSTNAGGSWADISAALPDIPATALLVDPQNPSVIYAGTDIGVYVSTDGGSSWNSFNEGLPDAVLISDLTMTPSNRTIRMATHGNGVFERRMPGNFPWISLVEPSGGEAWKVGTVHKIRWDHALVSSIRIEYSTNNGAVWGLVADSIGGTTFEYEWTVPPTLTTAARVRVCALADTTISAQSISPFTIYVNGNVVLLQSGWNLVSLPVTVTDHSVAGEFPGATSGAFGYGTGYVAADSLAEGTGYWIKYPGDGFVSISGSAIASDTVPVHAGWNLVGSLTSPSPAEGVQSDPPGLVTTLFYGYDGAYAAADSIMPGAGYWVKCSGAGVLMRSTTAAQKPGTGSPIAALRQMSSLTISDSRGRSQRLYVSRAQAEASPEAFEAPPRPPSGGFDARFASGRIAEFFGSSAHEVAAILLSGISYPVTIAWNCPPDQGVLELRTGTGRLALTGTGSVTLNRSASLAVASVQSTAETFPARFSLSENYPNPFNPSTEMRFDLPADGHVTLTVFTLLGEEVAPLVDERRSAGSYTVRWNAGELPSGVYLARLTSGMRTSTIKMLLMK